METHGSYLIHTTQENVWHALNDPDVLRQCIPGCESLNQLDDTTFDASVVAKIGPVKAKFKTHVSLEDIVAPDRYTLVGSSKGGAAGFGKGSAKVTLTTVEEGTQLDYTADFKVGGKLAQIGSRLITGATKKTADDFFGSLSALLSEKSSLADVETPQDAEDNGQAEALDVSRTEELIEERPLRKSRWVYVASLVIAAALLWWGFSS